MDQEVVDLDWSDVSKYALMWQMNDSYMLIDKVFFQESYIVILESLFHWVNVLCYSFTS